VQVPNVSAPTRHHLRRVRSTTTTTTTTTTFVRRPLSHQVPAEELDGARTTYLKKHPESAAWITFADFTL